VTDSLYREIYKIEESLPRIDKKEKMHLSYKIIKVCYASRCEINNKCTNVTLRKAREKVHFRRRKVIKN